jgi:hypothetical protein
MVRDWNPNGPKISVTSGPMGDIHTENLWEWFKFHFNSNIGFQYLCVDILAVLAGLGIMALGKSVVKSAKSVFKLLIEKFGKNFPGKIADFLTKFKPNVNGLPKEVVSWVDGKMSDVNKAIELFKTPGGVVKSVTNPSRLALSVAAGTGTYKLIDWFEKRGGPAISKLLETKPNTKNVSVNIDITKPEDKELINSIESHNQDIFTKENPIRTFKTIFKINGNKVTTDYLIINDKKYIYIGEGLKLKLKN